MICRHLELKLQKSSSSFPQESPWFFFGKLVLLEKIFKTEQSRTILTPEAAVLMLPSFFFYLNLCKHP